MSTQTFKTLKNGHFKIIYSQKNDGLNIKWLGEFGFRLIECENSIHPYFDTVFEQICKIKNLKSIDIDLISMSFIFETMPVSLLYFLKKLNALNIPINVNYDIGNSNARQKIGNLAAINQICKNINIPTPQIL